MKLFISADIEGVAGATAWRETDSRDPKWFAYFQRQMSLEVAAVCEGALKAGATDILVKDAHDTARNIDPSLLPRSVCINRGWSGSPFSMAAGLSADFDACAFTGYHSAGGSDGSPLAHTMSAEKIDQLSINGQRASEFTLHAYVAGMMGVPVVFLSGDAALCAEAEAWIPGITTLAVNHGSGNAATSIHPEDATEMMEAAMQKALEGDLKDCRVPMPDAFDVRVRYTRHQLAYSMSFYPGARQLDEKTIAFEHSDYNEVLRFFHFVL